MVKLKRGKVSQSALTSALRNNTRKNARRQKKKRSERIVELNNRFIIIIHCFKKFFHPVKFLIIIIIS